MASDTKKIVIEIKGSEVGKGKSGTTTKNSKEKDEILEGLQVAFQPLQSLENVIVGSSQSAKYIYDNLKNLAIENVNTTLGRTFRLTEDYMNQSILNNVQAQIGKASSFAASVIAGAKIGSIVAPGAGTVIGAVTGAAASIGSELISGGSTISQYYSDINAATYQSEFSRQRAGLVDEGRGTQN